MPDKDPWADDPSIKKAEPAKGEPAPSGDDDYKLFGASGSSGGGDSSGSIFAGTTQLHKAIDKAAESEPVTGLGSVVRNLGAGAVRAIPQALAHLPSTIGGMAKMVTQDPSGAVGFGLDLLKPEEGKSGGEAIANIPPTIMGFAGGGEAASSEGGMARIPSLELGERFGGYKSPVIPAPLQAASKAAEAIRPPGGILPDFEQNLAKNLPKIKAFASENGNPLHSQWETAEAARSLANKGLDHFKSNFLSPVEREPISMRSVPEYQGPVSGEGRMTTLGQIEKRISDINDMQRAATKNAKTTGAQMSAEQALGLENEAGKLRDILYREIGKRTGVDPEVIRDLRQSYGQQFNIADTIDAARRARLGQTGASAEMGGSVPFSKTGLLEKAMQGIRGGQDYIANARLRKALQAFEPEKVEYPLAKTIGNAGGRAPRQ